MKMKEVGPRGAVPSTSPLDLPLFYKMQGNFVVKTQRQNYGQYQRKLSCTLYLEMFTTAITEFHAAAKFTEAKSICENEGNQLLTVRNSQKENQLNSYHLNRYVARELLSICIEFHFWLSTIIKLKKIPIVW